MKEPLIEGIDFYWSEQGYKVFTENYHLKRGFCCLNNCKHCPFGYDKNLNKLKNNAIKK